MENKDMISKIEEVLSYSKFEVGKSLANLTVEEFNNLVTNFNLGINELSEKEIENNKLDLQRGAFRLNSIKNMLEHKYPNEKLENIKLDF